MDPCIVLRSFVRQLSCVANDLDNIQTEVIEQCARAKRDGASGLSYETCKDLILKSINLYPKTTLVLDAFDESDSSINNLVETLIELMDKSTRPVKIFISSRTGREVKRLFETIPTIIIDVRSNLDIEELLKGLQFNAWFNELPEELQQDISDNLASHSQGVYVVPAHLLHPSYSKNFQSANLLGQNSLGCSTNQPPEKTHIPRIHQGNTA